MPVRHLLHLAAAACLAPLLLAQAAPEGSRGAEGTFARYAVASDHAEASEAGAAILAAGGNAMEAAAATMLALGVVSPASSGMGGGGFGLFYEASSGTTTFLDFRERAPAAATADMFAAREGDDEETAANRSRAGGLAVGVPGEPAGVEAMLERFGSGNVTRREVVAPAVRLAREGFVANDRLARFTAWLGGALADDPVFGRWFPEGASAVPAGTRVDNPAHARTLEDFARRGARGFYGGRVGREIVRRVRAEGGILTMQDLQDYEVLEREALSAERLGYRWVTAPPPSAGGYTLLSSLALLDRWLPDGPIDPSSPALFHAFAESWKGAYADRHAYIGDPSHVDVPLTEMLDPSRDVIRARRFHPALAQPTSAYELPLPGRETRPALPGGDAGTSHLCVVDAEGNVAAVTTTVNLPFGARFTAAGIVMNDEMDDFAREVGEANAFGLVGGAPNLPGPGRRPVSSMNPTIVFEGDRPVLCVGASGGSRIPTSTLQVAFWVLRGGDTPAEALARRRVHHQGDPASLRYEEGMDEPIRSALAARGHALEEMRYSAVVQLIAVAGEGDARVLRAASDPRKGGRPAGR
jgi:gamma-glutamyltranspeptidase/glutathione hydrolase